MECEKNLNINNSNNNANSNANVTNKRKEEVIEKKNSYSTFAEPDIVLSRDYNENPILKGKILIIFNF
jgi:hypothetical protein